MRRRTCPCSRTTAERLTPWAEREFDAQPLTVHSHGRGRSEVEQLSKGGGVHFARTPRQNRWDCFGKGHHRLLASTFGKYEGLLPRVGEQPIARFRSACPFLVCQNTPSRINLAMTLYQSFTQVLASRPLRKKVLQIRLVQSGDRFGPPVVPRVLHHHRPLVYISIRFDRRAMLGRKSSRHPKEDHDDDEG